MLSGRRLDLVEMDVVESKTNKTRGILPAVSKVIRGTSQSAIREDTRTRWDENESVSDERSQRDKALVDYSSLKKQRRAAGNRKVTLRNIRIRNQVSNIGIEGANLNQRSVVCGISKASTHTYSRRHFYTRNIINLELSQSLADGQNQRFGRVVSLIAPPGHPTAYCHMHGLNGSMQVRVAAVDLIAAAAAVATAGATAAASSAACYDRGNYHEIATHSSLQSIIAWPMRFVTVVADCWLRRTRSEAAASDVT